MKAWIFATDDLPLAGRAAAWREAVVRLGLTVEQLTPGAAPRGAAARITSLLGMDFVRLDAGAQTISGPRDDHAAALWLVALQSGRARLAGDPSGETLGEGDILYGPGGQTAALVLESRCRLLWVRVPRMALGHRLIGAGGLAGGRLEVERGLAGVLSGLLAGISTRLADLTQDDLRPIEGALTEFLAAILADQPGGETAQGASQISRVSQIVEALLPEADLTLKKLAEASGLAPRTLQKLLAAAGQTFAGYVRDRRLERCRADLASPLAAGQTIGEIAALWGFSDPAYFSRAFRNAYGLSPRAYRRSAQDG